VNLNFFLNRRLFHELPYAPHDLFPVKGFMQRRTGRRVSGIFSSCNFCKENVTSIKSSIVDITSARIETKNMQDGLIFEDEVPEGSDIAYKFKAYADDIAGEIWENVTAVGAVSLVSAALITKMEKRSKNPGAYSLSISSSERPVAFAIV